MSQFPTLYGTATNGKIKQWSIEVVETMGSIYIRTLHGYEGGKLQQNEKTIVKGKNIGRSNETTPLQQAISEAQSTWQKKRDEKYAPRSKTKLPDASDAATVITNAKPTDDTVPSPMLAHDYNKRGRSLLFPCYVQPKLDGTRMVAIPGNGLFSRNRKAYPHLEHIREEIDLLSANIILDGELYSDTLTFQEIVGLVKNETLNEKQEQIKFHVYDMISDQNFQERCITLRWLFKEYNFQHLVLVKTEHCESEDNMKEKHAEYVADGYEGIMLRNMTGLYSNARSVHLQKYKEFFDEECEIVGFKEGDGLEKGCVIWICKIDGKEFACRPRGTREERQRLFESGDTYVGKMLTVRYQEKTDDGLLRFPVGIAIRDYE
jgi:DNA ligase-1